MQKDYKDFLDINEHSEGVERRLELMSDILKNGTFLPSTVELKDIDQDFTRWVEEELKIANDDGTEFPTMQLFSNQRFSEYSQTWKHTDQNNNLLLNFKTVSRENNPQYGKIQNGYWNIPGNQHFYTMKKKLVLDDNGTESWLVLKMHQPMALDLNYKITILTTQYHIINDFNTKLNWLFRSCQCYIRPQNHYMPMKLEAVSDESVNNIDDRQYYSQSYSIKVMAYIITEDDYRVEQIPYKRGVSIADFSDHHLSPEAEIFECEENNGIKVNIDFSEKCNKMQISFTNDTDFQLDNIELKNIRNNYKLFVNGDLISKNEKPKILINDTIKLIIDKFDKHQSSRFTIVGTKISK